MAIQVLNIDIVSFPKSGGAEKATMAVLYPMESFSSEKMVRKCAGRTTEVPRNREALSINIDLAHQLIDTGVFSSGAEYEPTFVFNENTMANEVVKLTPVNPELRKTFESKGFK